MGIVREPGRFSLVLYAVLAKICSAAVSGIEGFLVGVELDLSNGLPSFQTVGLPDSSVREARDRVVAALRNSGFEFPSRKVTVNLAPAEQRKAGTHFDLPIGLGLLLATQQVSAGAWAHESCFMGELALDGSVRPVSGVLAMSAAARAAGFKRVVVAESNQEEAAAAGLEAWGVSSLRDAVDGLEGKRKSKVRMASVGKRISPHVADLADVKGQSLARRALEIAASGGHNLLLIGPPGTGKSMLARCLPGLLPPLSRGEAVEVTTLLSVAGHLPAGTGLVMERPFRAPHTTASSAALVGGGVYSRPGEISLAHRGVLFLDELPEFPRASLEALRQPLEDRRITVARVRNAVTYPADFTLVAAMNPCPCGYRGSRQRECECSEPAANRYRAKISGPLSDRIDLQVEMSPVPFSQWAGFKGGAPETSAVVRKRVAAARRIAAIRNGPAGINGRLPANVLKGACGLDKSTWDFVEWAAGRCCFSPRALDRLFRVARTIADLAGRRVVNQDDLTEALQYRLRDSEGGAKA